MEIIGSSPVRIFPWWIAFKHTIDEEQKMCKKKNSFGKQKTQKHPGIELKKLFHAKLDYFYGAIYSTKFTTTMLLGGQVRPFPWRQTSGQMSDVAPIQWRFVDVFGGYSKEAAPKRQDSFKLLLATYTQCGNFMIFLSLRFYEKSILETLEVLNLPF